MGSKNAMPKSVLFVCLGNICRSPIAEAVLRRLAEARGVDLVIDSAGTGDWHVGHPPDPRAQAEAMRNGLDISQLRARQIAQDDFDVFDHIIAMDSQNLSDLIAMKPPGARAALSRLLDFVDADISDVPDPYYGGEEGFSDTFRLVEAGAAGLLAQLVSANRSTTS